MLKLVVCRLENSKQFYAHSKPGETERQRYQLTSMLLRQEVVWREVKLREEERTQLSSPRTPRSLPLSLSGPCGSAISDLAAPPGLPIAEYGLAQPMQAANTTKTYPGRYPREMADEMYASGRIIGLFISLQTGSSITNKLPHVVLFVECGFWRSIAVLGNGFKTRKNGESRKL